MYSQPSPASCPDCNCLVPAISPLLCIPSVGIAASSAGTTTLTRHFHWYCCCDSWVLMVPKPSHVSCKSKENLYVPVGAPLCHLDTIAVLSVIRMSKGHIQSPPVAHSSTKLRWTGTCVREEG